jgi:hypothetical protein
MLLRYVAGRSWRGPHAVIVIGGVGQHSAGILAERGRAQKTMFRGGRRKKGVGRGSGVPYRHSHFGVSPCAHMRCSGPYGDCVPSVSRHHTALCAVVVIIPAMKATVVCQMSRFLTLILHVTHPHNPTLIHLTRFHHPYSNPRVGYAAFCIRLLNLVY